jgi:hypothetical protein
MGVHGDQSELPPGTELGDYVITGVAGRGGMGVVYQARQQHPDRPVALKVIAGQIANDPAFQARFEQESRIAAQIEHPNVIPVYAVGQQENVLYIAMRYVDGADLRHILGRVGPLDLRRATTIIDQVAQALDAAHERGLVHRDVKPANILVASGSREHAYLTDFGLSRQIDGPTSGLTQTGYFVGTVDYASPEQVRGEPVDARTDIYSLGCVLFHALTGTVPYPLGTDYARMHAHDSSPPPSICERRPDLPIAFEAVIQRAMAKERHERYPSAGDLGRAALAAALGTRIVKPEQSVAAGAAAPTDRRSWQPPTQQMPPPRTETRVQPPRRPETPPMAQRVVVGARLGWVGLVATAGAIATIAATFLAQYGNSHDDLWKRFVSPALDIDYPISIVVLGLAIIALARAGAGRARSAPWLCFLAFLLAGDRLPIGVEAYKSGAIGFWLGLGSAVVVAAVTLGYAISGRGRRPGAGAARPVRLQAPVLAGCVAAGAAVGCAFLKYTGHASLWSMARHSSSTSGLGSLAPIQLSVMGALVIALGLGALAARRASMLVAAAAIACAMFADYGVIDWPWSGSFGGFELKDFGPGFWGTAAGALLAALLLVYAVSRVERAWRAARQ